VGRHQTLQIRAPFRPPPPNECEDILN
jgi:hypothetical protein